MIIYRFSKKILWILGSILLICGLFYYASGRITTQLVNTYTTRKSRIIYDRNDAVIAIEPNQEGNYAQYTKTVSPRFLQLLLQAEDKYFYTHPGINPFSIIRSLSRRFFGGSLASSTITQQLVKILNHNEFNRTSKNKIFEMFYAISLEAHLSKEEILNMYINSIYLGNNVQGIEMASKLYFEKSAHELTEQEMIQLISMLPSPSTTHPFVNNHTEVALAVAERLGVDGTDISHSSISEERYLQKKLILR